MNKESGREKTKAQEEINQVVTVESQLWLPTTEHSTLSGKSFFKKFYQTLLVEA